MVSYASGNQCDEIGSRGGAVTRREENRLRCVAGPPWGCYVRRGWAGQRVIHV